MQKLFYVYQSLNYTPLCEKTVFRFTKFVEMSILNQYIQNTNIGIFGIDAIKTLKCRNR